MDASTMPSAPSSTDESGAALPPASQTITRPSLLTLEASVNHTAPPGPGAIPFVLLFAVGTGNSVIVLVNVIRPILVASGSANHKFPSGPGAMSYDPLPGVGVAHS
jgi:hypothetical protein